MLTTKKRPYNWYLETTGKQISVMKLRVKNSKSPPTVRVADEKTHDQE